ncbi:chromate transporter [Putridiphycobacter roseus]|uniref:Chromate transporter n=1 Tax=Putridiphycobacter roseus TaxID=2219161 RepID=A0A2W1N2M1_9FLAO|nr:chromate efflux transporter [Putridiphycobacter roseus]PZE18104.1 chromate transporter [Putridiphycobacter roseus]
MEKEKNKLLEVAQVFFKLGLFAFGGPAAHIAMMEAEVVEKRKWMSKQHFLDLVGATNLIPGPNSTEMTMHCGHERAGFWGLFVAGLSFIIPAISLTGLLAYFYVTYGELPNVAPFIFGIKPVVLAIIAMAIYKLGKKALKTNFLIALGSLVLVISFLGVNEIYLLLGAGLVGAFILYGSKQYQKNELKSFTPFLFLQGGIGATSLISLSTIKIFWIFLKVGAVLYGSGYVLFAYLDAELVEKGFLSQQQLLDAIAIGQFTPGPVLSTATFIGYQLNGIYGALMASVGIFLPSFLFVLVLNPLVPKMRKSVFLSSFLDAVNVAAVAIMAAVIFEMGQQTLVDWKSIVLCVLSFLVVFTFKKLSPVWVILGGSLLGYLLFLI